MILDRLGLAPAIGLGNVTMSSCASRGPSRPAGPRGELPLVRVIGHHTQVYPVMKAEPPEDPEDRVRVFLGEHGERADHLAYLGHPFAPGIVYNQVTAIACGPRRPAGLPARGRRGSRRRRRSASRAAIPS